MSSLTSFMGLTVLSGTPPGDGGRAINSDLIDLVSWHPKSTWNNGAAPTITDDSSEDFYPGSLWSTDAVPP